ncbi:hypothetical protein LTR11_011669 [Exophiala xenobiotica]|nr:hypothetical protein LTR40_005256 [Exophiala xenobiotica]KAK5356127.1 hypothetical protein LTR11_011669 [Exophiala xenobiotica]
MNKFASSTPRTRKARQYSGGWVEECWWLHENNVYPGLMPKSLHRMMWRKLMVSQESGMEMVVELPEEDPEIVKRMIQHCYRAEYDDFESDRFLQHARVFSIATKFDISGLIHCARSRYWSVCTQDDWSVNAFLDSIPYAYDSTHTPFSLLRTTVRSCARARWGSLTRTEEDLLKWRSICLSVPWFCFDQLMFWATNPALAIVPLVEHCRD